MWRYKVREESRVDFERTYGVAGDWGRLFAQAPGYLGTELLHGDGCYLTIDRWRSETDFDRFLSMHADAYHLLDARCESWTIEEERIGIFGALPE